MHHMDNTATSIIEAFGGTSALAKAIGAPVSTVHSWKTSGTIPEWRMDRIAALAQAKGKTIPTGETA